MKVYFNFKDEPIITEFALTGTDLDAVYDDEPEYLDCMWFRLGKEEGDLWYLEQDDNDDVGSYIVAKSKEPLKLLVVLSRRTKKYRGIGADTMAQLLEWVAKKG